MRVHNPLYDPHGQRFYTPRVEGLTPASGLSVRLSLFGLALLYGSLGCAPKQVGPTAPSGYVFSVIAFPSSILTSFPASLIVRVQDAQGRPVDGSLVAFQVAPSWAHAASVSPSGAYGVKCCQWQLNAYNF
jgi:hypothetical protein